MTPAVEQAPQGGGIEFLIACGIVGAAFAFVVHYGPRVVSWAAGWWSALGDNVEASWDEIEAVTPSEPAPLEPLNWADFPEWQELRAAGRERAGNAERRWAA
jgi:hypothetical protein